jgi:hypothetical protein
MAYKWSEIALQATARDTERMKPRPTVTSRYLALIFTAMFDAWSMYDENASPAYWTGKVIKPAESERTEHNKEIAISYAAYHTLMEFYPADAGLFTDYMKSLGINPEAKKNGSLLSPESIGIKAAEDVLKARKKDGSNHYGNEEGGNGKPYFDYTYYEPLNGPD